ncbi:MAG: hypothetical protein MUO26_10540 [Methanotrichaceae archaeon]|nr:hypothetical protein [Methanotrichaceae archaeon]
MNVVCAGWSQNDFTMQPMPQHFLFFRTLGGRSGRAKPASNKARSGAIAERRAWAGEAKTAPTSSTRSRTSKLHYQQKIGPREIQ